METFKQFNLSEKLEKAIVDLGFTTPTPIQRESFTVVLSGKDVVGIAQTGTGKTLAYLLPLLHELKYSNQDIPRILILVPTRELVLQVVEEAEKFAKYLNVRVLGVYGGTNINTQKQAVSEGVDILVATPGRLYDLYLTGILQLKGVKKLVIDEVDVMLDLGFRYQLQNIFENLPERRQNIMFSATMTEEVDALIDEFFLEPKRIAIALSGTPLENISQKCYEVQNFYTKINLLKHLLQDKEEFRKVLVFVSSKKNADILFEKIGDEYGHESCVIHSNKTQNYRIKSVKDFDEGVNRILVATDVIARGLDLDKVTHVINMDAPVYPENYMHRIGRTGRAEQEGNSILFYTENEFENKWAIEELMNYEIPEVEFPEEVPLSSQLLPEERPKYRVKKNRKTQTTTLTGAFHEKKEKNKKINLGGSYKRKIAAKYNKPKNRGGNASNKNNKRK